MILRNHNNNYNAKRVIKNRIISVIGEQWRRTIKRKTEVARSEENERFE